MYAASGCSLGMEYLVLHISVEDKLLYTHRFGSEKKINLCVFSSYFWSLCEEESWHIRTMNVKLSYFLFKISYISYKNTYVYTGVKFCCDEK